MLYILQAIIVCNFKETNERNLRILSDLVFFFLNFFPKLQLQKK